MYSNSPEGFQDSVKPPLLKNKGLWEASEVLLVGKGEAGRVASCTCRPPEMALPRHEPEQGCLLKLGFAAPRLPLLAYAGRQDRVSLQADGRLSTPCRVWDKRPPPILAQSSSEFLGELSPFYWDGGGGGLGCERGIWGSQKLCNLGGAGGTGLPWPVAL